MASKKSDTIDSGMNIWNKTDFAMAGLGKRCKACAKIRHFFKCIKWSRQRIRRGYADCDVWDMYSYLQNLLPDMLQNLKTNRHGSPGYLGTNYTNADGILVNDDCHAEWDKILARMIFLWRESNEDTCQKKNPYEEEHMKNFEEFNEKYGLLGEKLQTKEELEENKRRGGGGTVHFMSEIPEYREIDEKYREEEKKLEKYRSLCKDEAMDMMKKYFFDLWD